MVEIVGAWNLYNFLLVAYALRAVFERPDQLDRPRCGISSPAMLRWSQSAPGEDEQAAEVQAEIVDGTVTVQETTSKAAVEDLLD